MAPCSCFLFSFLVWLENATRFEQLEVPCDIKGGMTNDPHAHLHIPIHCVRRQVGGCNKCIVSVGYEDLRMELEVLIVVRKTPSEDLWQGRSAWPHRDENAPVIAPVRPHALVNDDGDGNTALHGGA